MNAKIFFNIRQIENIEKKFSIKIVFQQILLIATCVAFITLIVLSYTGQYANININDLDNYDISLRVMRALFTMFMTWYVFASIWAIKCGIELIENKKLLKGILLIFSFIPLIALINLILFAIQINNDAIKYYKELLFTQDQTLKQMYSWGSWRRYTLLIMLIITLPVIVFVFWPDTNNFEGINKYYDNIWFYSFDYFTIQTNLMILIFTFISFLFPGLKIFKNNNLQIAITIYIFIVGVTWNAILLPSNIQNGKAAIMDAYSWTMTCWFHIVNPIVFVICSLVLIFKQPFKRSTSFVNMFWLGMTYPIMYLTYVILVPFTAGVSIYGSITNVNPDLNLNINLDLSRPGNYANFAIIFGYLFLFLVLIWLLWFLDKKINSKRIILNTQIINNAN